MVNVRSPPVVWNKTKYPLSRLKDDFGIPDFQRKASSKHIRQIVKSILSNQFYDNVIRYYIDDEGKKQLLDGQQRVEALWIAHTEHGVEKYDLVLGEFEKEFARSVFRRLNMGRPLQTRDHSKALDDGNVSFFSELFPWLSHERTVNKSSYVEMLHAVNYVRGQNKPVTIRDLDQVVDSITKREMEVMKRFCEATRIVAPVVFKAFIYKAIIYRNVFKVAFDKNLTQNSIVELLKLCQTSKKLMEISKQRSHFELPHGYKVIHDDLLPKVLKP